MTGKLLLKGMFAGLIAGVFAFAFAHHFGEPQVDRAIAFEASIGGHHHEASPDESSAHAHPPAAEEEISRHTQSGAGLLSGMVLLGAALGGGLALVWAFSYQRVGQISPKALALCLAVAGFLIFSLLPGLKYPPNPPAVGNPDTIGYRTSLYFIMMFLSACIIYASILARKRLTTTLSAWNSCLVSTLMAIVLLAAAYALLPAINDIPNDFSADLLWRFRLSSFGIQFVLWGTIGIMFGILSANMFPQKKQSLSYSASMK